MQLGKTSMLKSETAPGNRKRDTIEIAVNMSCQNSHRKWDSIIFSLFIQNRR